MEIIDTQIISYAIKRKTDIPVSEKYISAITANELLLVQSTDPLKANYYIPVLSSIHLASIQGNGIINRDHPFNKRVTDQVVIDFGNEYPTIIEYGNLAVSILVNQRVSIWFNTAIQFLDKAKIKTVRKRFNFLLENGIQVIPLNKEIVNIGVSLLQNFTQNYELKGNFRNSLNDMLILATAIHSSAILVTKDSLLNKFAASKYSGAIQRNEEIITIDFSNQSDSISPNNLESKGYINKGWQVKFRKYGNIS